MVEEACHLPRLARNKLSYANEGLTNCKQKLLQWRKLDSHKSQEEMKAQLALLSYLQKGNRGHLNDEIKQVQRIVNRFLEEDHLK